MSKNKELPLAVLNLCAKGKSQKEAWEIYNKGQSQGSKPETSVEGGGQKPKKLSAAEKKAALVPEFETLGVETPPEGDSLAKWEQSLAAAKEAAETEGGDTEGGDTEAADLM